VLNSSEMLNNTGTMRRAWILLTFVLLLGLAVALMAALRSERFVLFAVDWVMATFTDYRLELSNPRIRLLDGQLSADAVHLVPEHTDGPPLVSALDVEASTSLYDLFSTNLAGTHGHARSVQIYVSEEDTTEDPSPMEWLEYVNWLPLLVEVDSVHIVRRATTTLIVRLRDLRAERVGLGEYHVLAQADYESEPLRLDVTLRGVRQDKQFVGVEITADLAGQETSSSFNLEGELKGTDNEFQYDFTVAGHYADIDEFLEAFRSSSILEGSLKINARMRGDTTGFTLSDAQLVLDNMPAYGFEAGGRLEIDFSGDSQINVIAAGEMDSLEYLTNWIGVDLTDLGRAQASVELSGSLDRPVADLFVHSTQQENGLTIKLNARNFELLSLTGDSPSLENRLHVDVYAPTLAVLEPWLGAMDFEPGAWSASGTLAGVEHRVAVENLIVEAGTAGTLFMRAEGAIDNILGAGEHGLALVTGIDASLNVQTSDSFRAGEIFDLDLPGGHRMNADFHLSGSGTEMLITDGQIDVQAPGVTADAQILGGVITPEEEVVISGIKSTLRVEIENSSVLERYAPKATIPELGALLLTGTAVQHGDRLALENLEFTTTSGNTLLKTVGNVDNLLDFSGVSLNSRFQGLRVSAVLKALLEDFSYDKPLGELRGSFNFRDDGENWYVKKLVVQSTEPGGPVELSVRGDVSKVIALPTADLEARFRIRDPGLLEALLGLRMNPVEGRVVVNTQPGKTDLSSRTRIGNTRINMDTVIAHSGGNIDALRMAINTPHLYLDDLGLQSKATPGDDYKPASQVETPDENPVASVLDSPPPFPLDIGLYINGITGDNTDIEAFDIHLTGDAGRYTLRKFSIDYAHALVELRGAIDLNPTPPAITIGGEALLVPMNAMARDLGMDIDVQGTLTLRGGLTTTGTNRDDFIRTLDGSLAVALEDAVIQGAAYDVLATDLLAWIYSGAALETSTPVDCAMGMIDFDQGVASTDTLYIETPQMVATGKGRLNMVNKTIDLTVTPMSKSRAIQVPSSVRLKGPLNNPRPIIAPVRQAMNIYTEAMTLIPRLTMQMFGIKTTSDKTRRPCSPD
jgi:hypothetical protein